jgi:hypothetical protein
MASVSTKEYCRGCGVSTLHKRIYKEKGFIVYQVLCPECKAKL